MRWTCLVLDLRSILSLYLNRRYSHLKSIKLCANLLVKNLCTSDLVFDPGEELRPQGGLWFLQPSLDGTPVAFQAVFADIMPALCCCYCSSRI